MPAPSVAANLVLAVLFSIWAIGFAGIASAWGLRWSRIRAAVRAGSPVYLETPIKVITSPTLLEPGVFGIYHPVLMLPEGIFDRLTPAQLTAVIEHELCHFRHRDNFVAAIHMFVETVFWFHPLLWWIGKWIVEERERACDEEVLQVLGEPRVYAEALLGVCKLYLESPLVCVSGVTGSNLRRRIEAIMVNPIARRLNYGRKAAIAILAMAAVVIPIAIGLIHAPIVQVQAQAVQKPKFEVASIKRCTDPRVGGEGRGAAPPDSPNRMSISCWSLASLIRTAYVVFAGGHFNGNDHPAAIEQLPAWANSELFTIEAKADGSPGQYTMRGPMLQALLEDRFALKIHAEMKDERAYALTVAKDGLKLQPFHGSCIPLDPIHPRGPRQNLCRGTPQDSPMSLDVFGWLLGNPKTNILDAPVINKTGITGDFHVSMEPFLKLSHTPAGAPADDPLFASVFTAVKDLGLKLQATKAPRQYFVIDHVERPSAN